MSDHTIAAMTRFVNIWLLFSALAIVSCGAPRGSCRFISAHLLRPDNHPAVDHDFGLRYTRTSVITMEATILSKDWIIATGCISVPLAVDLHRLYCTEQVAIPQAVRDSCCRDYQVRKF